MKVKANELMLNDFVKVPSPYRIGVEPNKIIKIVAITSSQTIEGNDGLTYFIADCEGIEPTKELMECILRVGVPLIHTEFVHTMQNLYRLLNHSELPIGVSSDNKSIIMKHHFQ